MATDAKLSKNPLQREGTSQVERLPAALDPLFAKLDDRSLYDYLDFVYKYSDHIIYHTVNEIEKIGEDPTWQAFFSDGIILLSHITRNSSVASHRTFKADLNNLDSSNADDESITIQKHLLSYFDKLEDWHSKFRFDDSFKEVLRLIITDENNQILKNSITQPYPSYKNGDISLDELRDEFLLKNSEIIRIYDGLVQEAEKELSLRLEKNNFTPHVGLLLTFLDLFEKSRDNQNTLTGRHLQFYYENILQIEKKNFTADEAHITIGLAKNKDLYELKEGTVFKGGKDSEGNNLVYSLTEDFIASKSAVKSLKSSFLDNDAGIIRAAENAASLDGIKEPLPEDDPVWSPFKNNSFPAARLGFAISSPLLRMSSGDKFLYLNFDFDSEDSLDELKAEDFTVCYSTKGKWADAQINHLYQEGNNVTFILNLDNSTLPVLDYNAVEMEDEENFETEWPVFKFELKEEAHKKRTILDSKTVEYWSIFESVSNVRDAVILNDNGRLKIEKPFLPFGALPVKGSQFYMGHAEIFSKKLTSLTLDWDWMDEPVSLETHYKKYSDGGEIPEFGISSSFLDNKAWTEPDSHSLLNSSSKFINSLSVPLPENFAYSEIEPFNDYTNDVSRGFLRLKLTSPNMAFGHKTYPQKQQVLVIDGTTDDLKLLHPPYTPQWENFRLRYTAELKSSKDADLMKLYSLNEFGHENTDRLVPQFEDNSRLYIGLENVEDGSSVSLLMQFAEGTADPFSSDEPNYKWSYLSDSGWLDFESTAILKDTTVDLLQSGILRFKIDTYALETSHMPDNQLWLRLSVKNDPALFNDFISVQTQATTVKFENRDNTLEHLGSSVEAGTISKLLVKDPAVKSVSQPFSSFNGQPEENEEAYTIRVSERLRHKDRAVQIWDYERLILENFNEIFKVKCLNHTGRLCTNPGETTISYSEISPGDVTIVAIPDLKNSERYNITRPAVKFATLRKIEDFLRMKCSEWVNLEVRNPKYEELNVTLRVRFYDEISDPGYYVSVLKEDINDFLTPWASDMGRLTLGSRMYKSTILNFIEEREYVDYLIDFDATLKVDGITKTFEEELVPSSSLSLIVPGSEHDINYF